jgi:hypothetical protein
MFLSLEEEMFYMRNIDHLTVDEREKQMWKASHELVQGEPEMAREVLDDLRQSSARDMQAALIGLNRGPKAGRLLRRRRYGWTAADEQELWMASWMYMNGKIGVREFEDAEAPYTQCFERALRAQAGRSLTGHLGNFLRWVAFVIRKPRMTML